MCIATVEMYVVYTRPGVIVICCNNKEVIVTVIDEVIICSLMLLSYYIHPKVDCAILTVLAII